MEILGMIKGLVVVYGLGLAITRLVLKNCLTSKLLEYSLAYGLGLGFFSYGMFLAGIIWPENPFGILTVPAVILAALLWILSRVKRKTFPAVALSPGEKNPGSDWIIWACLLFIAANVMYVFSSALLWPVKSWDGLATVAFKAKVIYFDRSLVHFRNFPHAGYPLLTPLAEVWVALNLGHWSDRLIKVIFPLAYISFLGIQFSFLRYFTNIRWSLLGVVLLAAANLFTVHATISMRDFFMLYYNCTALMLLVLWNEKEQPAFLLLAGLCAGLGTWTKVEGQLYMGVALAVLSAMLFGQRDTGWRQKIKHLVFFLFPGVLMTGIFTVYRLANGVHLEQKAALSAAVQVWPRVQDFWVKFIADIFFSANWNIIWFMLLVSLLPAWGRTGLRRVKFLLLALCLHIAVLMLVGVFTESYKWIAGELWTAGLPRLTLHFFPLVPALIVLLIGPDNPGGESGA